MPADGATATSTPAAIISKEKQEVVGKVNGLKATTTTSPAATTTSPAATTLKDKQETVSKVNGLKQLSKKKSLPEIVKQPDQSLSNGLANGNTQQAEASVDEQLKQPTTVNGKIQRNNNKISVKSLTPAASTAAITSTPATTSTPTSTPTAANQDAKPLTDEVEPPKKRPKLQLKEKTKPSTSPKSIPPAAAVAVAVDAADEEEEEVEDISDEAYIVRHQRALIEERRRFETYLRFPWSTRSRANRRADSRAESSGANTPDPASPAAPQLAGPSGMDNESIPSPLAQTMLQNPLDEGELATTMATTKGKRQERRRTTSSKLKDQDRRSATPDTREVSGNGNGNPSLHRN